MWDGNEVWLLTAGGATFAAFPEWYATLFSGFYLPLLLILLALIARAVAIEYRGKINDETWRNRWDLGDHRLRVDPLDPVGRRVCEHRARREPIDADHQYTGGFSTCSTRSPCLAASSRS